MSDLKELLVTFDIGTIDHLGVKLYSTIPPMIAELVSNAWDADAHVVHINFDESETKSIRVRDDGSGMTFDELNAKFLKIGRNRRVENNSDRTKDGRPVLGKKGLGKLSMFGIGKRITVSTVKNGLLNAFLMDYDDIKNDENHGCYKPQMISCDEKTVLANGTEILIENIARQSSFDLQSIRRGLLSRFRIFSSDFVVKINDQDALTIAENELQADEKQFAWIFPDDFEVEQHEFQSLYNFATEKGVKGNIYTAETPLPKNKQGIVLFSRGKLVQERIPFSERGNDNFFQYMSGEFFVDFVDESFEKDNCSTDRKSLAWDTYENENLEKLKLVLEKIVSITQRKWRQRRKKEKERKIQEKGIGCDEWIIGLTPAEQPLAKKLVSAILENESISEESTIAYISCIKDMYSFSGFQNFTQKLDGLDVLGSENAIKLLTDWSEIEAKEYAKISMGRIKAIEQFDKYIRENASESKVIQKFLEEFPWLLDPKMSKFEREITYSNLLNRKFDDHDLPEHDRRIDFLCTNSSGIIHVIELKRPNIKLTTKQLNQISAYVEFIEMQFPTTVGKVKGYLISDNMTYEPGAKKTREGLEAANIFVKSYSDLLAEARRYNGSLYEMYEKILETKNR